MKHTRLLSTLSLIFMILFSLGLAQSAQVRSEEELDYFTKWLKEDVVYIISDEERSIFEDLSTTEEKEQFIEQFWLRRDTNPTTANNEFKEEHYRRIAYANEHFYSGEAGWETDRGRMYIVYGPPDEVEKYPAGGRYQRKDWEGGGSTSVYPFERWRYQYIEGVGDDIEIEFVDQTSTGEYRIAMNPGEKDALMMIPGAGLTLSEKAGLTEKADRPYFNRSAGYVAPHSTLRPKDEPFERMRLYYDLQRPPVIKFEDLKGIVTTDIRYDQLPYKIRTDVLKLSLSKALVLVTVEIENRDLEFAREFDVNRAVVNTYGRVTSLTGRTMAEFEHSASVAYSDADLEKGLQKRSMYQKIIAVPPGQRYKLDLALKDNQSGEAGVLSRGIIVPKYGSAELEASSIILANYIVPVPEDSDYLGQYVIGDLKVQPNVTSAYLQGEFLYIYLQVYNLGVDQASFEPLVQVSCTLKSNGETIRDLEDVRAETEQFFTGERLVIVGRVPLQSVPTGHYNIEVQVTDQIGSKSLVQSSAFTVNQPHSP